MDLVGRDRELGAVAHALEDVRGGRGRVLAVLGEPGIGKSALLAAIADAARPLLVLEGRAAEHERDLPFAVAVDAFDRHVATMQPSLIEALGDDLGAVLPAAAAHSRAAMTPGADPAERFRYHRALRALLELLGRERPVALLLDDLHWADHASLELVLHLLRRPPATAFLLAFALRPAAPACPPLLDAARRAPGFEQLALAPLGHDESLGLITGVRDRRVRERLAREAGGNPLFLRELERSADRRGALPDTLLAAIGLEVAALAPEARALLEGAAVAGDPFDPELATTAAGLAPDDATLDGLVAAHLVRATRDGRAFAFRHPLVRRIIYDSAPPAWRLAAHERVAAALEQRGAGPAVRAYHVAQFARPGDETAIALLSDAADAATSASPANAARWHAAALRLLSDGDRLRRARLLAPMALALASAGLLEDSREKLVEALELLPGDLALVTACAQIEFHLGRHAQARRRLLAAHENAPHGHRAALAFELAAGAMTDCRVAELRAWADCATRAAAGADPALHAGAAVLGALGASWTDGADADGAALERAVARLHDLDDEALVASPTVLLHVGRAQLRLGRFAEASATLARAQTIARRTRRGETSLWLLGVRAWTLWLLLDLDTALAELEAAEESARLQGAPNLLLLVLCMRAMVQHDRGETAEAERAAEECAELARALEPSATTRLAACTLAAIHADRDPERCISEMTQAAGVRLELMDKSWSSWLLLGLVRAAVAAGRLEDAERWEQHAAARSAALRLPANAVRASGARAELLLARGHAAAAAELAQQAAAAADRIPAPLDAADARLLAGRALAAAGDTERAKAVLQRVAADAARGGALRLRDAAARELRRLGARVTARGQHAASPSQRPPLTQRERHLAELVAEGRSNKQVAATLHLRVGTVENALTRVYAKLGVRSRAQLMRAWAPADSARPR